MLMFQIHLDPFARPPQPADPFAGMQPGQGGINFNYCLNIYIKCQFILLFIFIYFIMLLILFLFYLFDFSKCFVWLLVYLTLVTFDRGSLTRAVFEF